MPDEKAPSSGAFLPASLMYFYSGQPMHHCSGVDSVFEEIPKRRGTSTADHLRLVLSVINAPARFPLKDD